MISALTAKMRLTNEYPSHPDGFIIQNDHVWLEGNFISSGLFRLKFMADLPHESVGSPSDRDSRSPRDRKSTLFLDRAAAAAAAQRPHFCVAIGDSDGERLTHFSYAEMCIISDCGCTRNGAQQVVDSHIDGRKYALAKLRPVLLLHGFAASDEN